MSVECLFGAANAETFLVFFGLFGPACCRLLLHTMDNDDDAWSYSFPPSVESLPLHEESATSTGTVGVAPAEMPPTASAARTQHGAKSNNSTNGDTMTPASGGAAARLPLRVSSDPHSSHSSLLLQSPFMVRPSPADPHTTREDASLVMLKELDEAKAPKVPQKSYMMARTLLNSNLEQADEDHATDTAVASPDLSVVESPRFIAFRKARAGRPESDGNIHYDALTPFSTPKEKFDPRLYVDEKYKDTQYRYATIKRNTDFHQLFISLDLTDRLLDDFSCALSREILLQGRLYVSEQYVCFNLNLLGWVTNLVIPQADIVRLEKKLTAGLFPNGIVIETKDAKHTFASFISRDSTIEFMRQVWQGATGKVMPITATPGTDAPSRSNSRSRTSSSGSSNDNHSASERRSGYTLDNNGIVQMVSSKKLAEIADEHNSSFDSYINSIDGDDQPDSDSDVSEGDDDEDADLSEHEKGELDEAALQVDTRQDEDPGTIVKLKPDSKYVNMGPDTHPPTLVPVDYVNDHSEIPLCKETIEAPLGVIFNILFGSDNVAFHTLVLERNDASEITPYGPFHPMADDPTKLERSYTYRKALGYSIGPKLTKCEVSEMIEHLDLNDHVVVLTSTVTPDVPLGNSFSVKTRYCMSWGPNNTTTLVMSYFIKWTGRLWIKSVIEKQSLSGQKAATEDLLEHLKATIAQETAAVAAGAVASSPAATMPAIKKLRARPKSAKQKEPSILPSPPSLSYLFTGFVVAALLVILLLEAKMFRTMRENNQLLRHQLLATLHLVLSAQGKDASGEVDPQTAALWDWVRLTRGSGTLSHLDKVEFLTNQLRLLYNEQQQQDNIEGMFNDLKQQAQGFYPLDLLNVAAIKNALGDLL